MKSWRLPLEWAVVTAASVGFFVYKIFNLTFRYSDHNLYFFEAGQLLHGLAPHRDFFLTDTGFYVALLAGIKFLIGAHILWLQILPIILHVGSAVILFLFLKHWRNPLAAIAPLLYLFSFSTLANSDYATGEEWAVILLCGALLALAHKRPKLTGVLLALACLFKLYVAAAVIGICIVLIISKDYAQAKRVILAGLATGGIALIFLAFPNPGQFWRNVILFNLHRPPGLEKAHIFAYFFQREWPLLLLALGGIITLGKKRWLIWLPIALSVLFFILFKDIYYLYFQILLAFLVISAVSLLGWIWKKFPDTNSTGPTYILILLVTYTLFMVSSIAFYRTNWQDQGRFTNTAEAAATIKNLPEPYPLYGSYDSAPLLSLLSGRPLYKNYYDTNPISFLAGRLDKNAISAEAAQSGVYLLARITDLPEYDIEDYGYQDYFSAEIFSKFCSRVAVFPSTSNSQDNFLIIYKCKSD